MRIPRAIIAAALLLWGCRFACAHEGLIHESHDHFPEYTDAESRTLPAGQSFSTKLAWLTYHNLGHFEVDGAEIVLLDRPFDNQFDPQQTGHGFIGHSGGSTKFRNATIRSENPDGVPGHVLFTGSHAVDIEGCAFDGVGRTLMGALDNAHLGPNREVLHEAGNQIGRYALHLHHVTLPFRVVDTTLKNGRKVALAIHNSDGGLVEGVTVDNFAGAGIVLEAGTEENNIIRDCRISNIIGDGRGVQGHNGGTDAILVGDDTPGNPRRTIGGLFSEGAGLWFRSPTNDIERVTITDCFFGVVGWVRNLPDNLGAQAGHKFDDITVERCRVGVNLQGMVGDFVAKNLTVRDCNIALDLSYNDTVRFENLTVDGCDGLYKNGFTSKLELINAKVTNTRGGFDLPASFYVEGGEFQTSKPAFNVLYQFTSSRQRQCVIRNAKFDRMAFAFHDPNKNRTFHAPLDVLVYGHNGEDFQVFMDEQHPDYIPTKTSTLPMRITPERGLTNAQLWSKYRVCLGGKMIPPNAVLRPGIGWTAPIPDDLTGPAISDMTIETTATTATIRFKTDEPASSRSEYATGDIKLGAYATLGPVSTDLKTEHVVTFTGLKPATKYNFIAQVFDETGNLGGDTASAGINYLPRTFKTRAN